ncbi:hypothetical protein JCM9279_003273 [Rhodotorula babjevae]
MSSQQPVDANGRPVYPVLLDPGSESAIPAFAMTSDLRFATTYLTPDEQRAEWRAEQERERIQRDLDAQAAAAREE